MLNFWYRSLNANDCESLEALARDICEFYRNRARAEAIELPRSYGDSAKCAGNELQLCTLALAGQEYHQSWTEAIATSVLLPFVITNMSGSPVKLRAIGGWAAYLLRIGPYLDSCVTQMRIPKQYRSTAKLFLCAFGEVAINEIAHGNRSVNPLRWAVGTLYVATFLKINTSFIKFLAAHGVSPAVCDFVCSCTCWGSSVLIQRLLRFGMFRSIEWMIEGVASYALKLFRKKLPELPIDVDTPPELECNICHELLNDPVEVSGTFFCRDCLVRWMRINSVHPVTSLNISADMVSKSFVMSHVAYKYHALCVRECNQ